MSNDFFDDADWTEVARGTTARAEDVNALKDAVVVGFDRLPGQQRLYEGRVTYCGATAGSANAQTCSIPYAAQLTDGLWLRVKAGATNTGALTLDATPAGGAAFGAIAVVDYSGTALAASAWVAGAFYDVVYNSTPAHFRIINPVISIASVTTFDINSLTQGSDVDSANDFVAIYDASAGALRKVIPSLIADEQALVLASQVYGIR